MSASQSRLAGSHYNYDMVVSTTQLGINSTMKGFLAERQPHSAVVTCCYVGDKYSTRPIDYQQLLQLSQGSDPFKVRNGADPKTYPDLLNLAAAGFVQGFRFQVGLPPMSDPMDTPDIIRLESDGSTVEFFMLCDKFQVVGFDPGYGWNPVVTWVNNSQQLDGPWTAMSEAVLTVQTVPPTEYGTLPPAVRGQASITPGDFSIQALLLDLISGSGTLRAIPDVGSQSLSNMLLAYFIDAYTAALGAVIGPVALGYTIVEQPAAITPSEMPVTAMNVAWSPVVDANGKQIKDPTADQQQITTLGYLCATDNRPLPAPYPFTWNWVDDTMKTDAAGVSAVNLFRLITKMQEEMLPIVKANCYIPHVRVSLYALGAMTVEMDVKPGGNPGMTLDAVQKNGAIQALTFTYSGHDDDTGEPEWMNCNASLDTYYEAMVTFLGNTITVDQKQIFTARVMHDGAPTSGEPVDIRRQDTCTLQVGADGQLIAVMATPIPATNTPSTTSSSFWSSMLGADNIYDQSTQIVAATVANLPNVLPYTFFQNFVFPGGQTFSYKEVSFAASGDLVSYLNYVDPGATPGPPRLPGQQFNNAVSINDGQWFGNDGWLTSANHQYSAVLQDDGNFVLVRNLNGVPDLGHPYWSIFANRTDLIVGTFTGTPAYASLQPDGNFVLYNGRSPQDPSTPYWAINHGLPTLGRYTAILNDDGNFAVYACDKDGHPTADIKFQSGPAKT